MTAPDPLFSPDDLRQMADLGISAEEAAQHVDLFRNPPPFTRVLRPCRVGDGIRALSAEERPALVARFEDEARRGRVSKFVPASGAASRMFKALLGYLDQLDKLEGAAGSVDPEPPAEARTFFAELPRFAFYEALAAVVRKRGVDLTAPLGVRERKIVLRAFLSSDDSGDSNPSNASRGSGDIKKAGLDYAEQPKGLLLFHRYPAGPRTPFEEHLVEAAATVRDDDGVCRLHFTVSPQHEAGFRQLLRAVRTRQETRHEARFQISFSHQRRATDTLAVDPHHQPFRTESGELLFRPGGHGALIDNLQSLADGGCDVVLLKNIDNVVPESRQPTVVLWKKLLGGYLLALAARAEAHLAALDLPGATAPEPEVVAAAAAFLAEDLSRPLPPSFATTEGTARIRTLVEALNRPLRVCGVVRNQGEPGGGPFWVAGHDGQVSLQIVETSQIDPKSAEQQAALRGSTHFNPVDVACSLRDRHGRAYDLARFIDPTTVFIAAKSHEGRPLLALERPGLWNGGMAGWNTVFVEVPDETFAPVKTVLDLLRPEHQG